MHLPRAVGAYVLEQRLGIGGIAESFKGTTAGPSRAPVVIRRLLPFISSDATRRAAIEQRVRDLISIRHPFLVPVLAWIEEGDEYFVIEEFVEGTDLGTVLASSRRHHTPMTGRVALTIATQVCNALEALHGRPGAASGVQQVLHLSLRPDAIRLTPDGRVVVGGYGLTASPTALPHGGVSATNTAHLRYLSPEQTLSDGEVSPASDIFSLASIIFELTAGSPLFETDSNLRTLHAVRRANVGQALEKVRAVMPGLDRVLVRALAEQPRHRYHRAFVLREDLRALMAQASPESANDDIRSLVRASTSGASVAGQHRLLASAPDPTLVPPDSETLHNAHALDAGLFEDTFQSGGPPPLVTDEMGVFAAPDLRGLAVPEPTQPDIAAPPNLAQRAPPPPAHLPLPLSAGPPPERFLVDVPPPPPSLAPPPAVPGRPPAPPPSMAAEADLPLFEELTGPRDVPARQATWAVSKPVTSDSTGAFGGAPAAPPQNLRRPPAGPLPPLVPHQDAFGAPVVAQDTAFLPAPPTLVPPPPDDDLADLPLPMGLPPVPAPAAPASPQDTGFFAAPLPPAPPMPRTSPVASPPPFAPAPTPPPPAAPPPVAAATPPPVALPAVPPPVAAATPPPAALPAAPPPAPPVSVATVAPPPWSPPEASLPPPVAAPVPVVAAPSAYASEQLDDDIEAPPKAKSATPTIVFVGVAMAAVALIACTGVLGVALTSDVFAPSAPVAQAEAPTATAEIEAVPETTAAAKLTDDTGGPAVAAAEPSPVPSAEPPATPRPAAPSVAAARPAPRAPEPARRAASDPPPRATREAPPRVAPVPLPPPEPPPAPAEPRDGAVDYENAARVAARGGLDPATRQTLESTPIDDPNFTRAYTLLASDALARKDPRSAERYLEQLMALTENRYNPVLLGSLSRLQVNRRQYTKALDNAHRAEQHWARIPSGMMFEKKAEIYEVQAAATQGLLYDSDNEREQLQLAEDAIQRWVRYREHVSTASRDDLIANADTQLEKLRAIRTRLE